MNTASTTSVLASGQTQGEMANFGRAALADYFGDMVIYRNLEPLDRRLPGLKSASYKMELPNDQIPRKLDQNYAKAAVWLAQRAQKLREKAPKLRELLFVGDTVYNDGQAYTNMKQLGGWEGSCFIGVENAIEECVVDVDNEDNVYCANRWSSLGEWVRWAIEEKGLHIDAGTVVIVDIDKTALGAKGRNDQVINQARLEGIYRTMDSVLGKNFDRSAFEEQYAELNRARYHFLTEDNQDYLAYICLVLNTDLITYDEVLQEVQDESLEDFEQFLRWVNSRMMINPAAGAQIREEHEAVVTSVRNGDPTPFKRFRRQEFITTLERMGQMPDDTPVDELLDSEITLTNEVCELVEWLHARGCLLLCLSDKPDEASCPDPRSENKDLLPIHRAQTHRVGTSVQEFLQSLG